MTEGARAFCFCEDGYAAEGRACVPVEEPRTLWTNRRTRWAGPRVVEIAASQAGMDARGVGAALRTYPFGLGRYVWRGELWCTDFVSWTYAVAGVPLTGGSEGGWLVRNNEALRTWFERHGLWIDRGGAQWPEFEPRPGDYVRLHTRSGVGHSGIVQRLDGDTLYTIEGNVGNRVRLRRHRRFRDSARIDGIGMLTLPPAR